MSLRSAFGSTASALLSLALLGVAETAWAQELDPWSKGSQWITVCAGYAKSSAEGAADGKWGGGFGYTVFRNSKWSYTADAEVNLLGTFGAAAEIEMPWRLGIVRHYRLPTVVRPFLGFGFGSYFHKLYRTGADKAIVLPGAFLSGGFNMQFAPRSLLGAVVRANLVRYEHGTDPVFGSEVTSGKSQSSAIHWDAKLSLSRAF